MYRAFPGSKYYGGSAPSWTDRWSMRPAVAPRLDARDNGETRTVPVFAVISLDGGGARLGPCGITTVTPQHFTVVSRSVVKANPGVPNNTLNMLGCTALGPYPPGSSRSSLERRKRRFLAYSFPSRSPDPHHLAVLTRSDFVGAACHPHRHHPARAAPSFTVLLRQDRRRRSHTSSRIHSASRRTQRQLKIDPFSTG